MRNKPSPGQNGQSNPKGKMSVSGTMTSQQNIAVALSQETSHTQTHKRAHSFTNNTWQYTNAHLISQVEVFIPVCWSLRQSVHPSKQTMISSPLPLCRCERKRSAQRGCVPVYTCVALLGKGATRTGSLLPSIIIPCGDITLPF